MPQDIPATCDGCGKKLSIERALSCQKGCLVLARHDKAEKEWIALGVQALFPNAINYEAKINITTVQRKRTRAGVRQEGGEADGSRETVGEAQGGRERQ